jgi:acyl carrier protein
VQQEIIKILAEVKKDPSLASRVTGSSHLVDDLSLDSLQMIDLILKVQDKFSVVVDFDSFQVEHLSSLDRFTQYVSELPRA